MRLMKWGIGAVAAGAVLFGALALAGVVQASGQFERGKIDAVLAEKLNVTVEELQAAREEARLQVINDAAAAGDITAEQAERLRNAEPGELRGRHGPGKHGFRGAGAIFVTVAETLGMTKEEFVAELRAGKSPAAIAEENGVSSDQLKATIVANVTATVTSKAQSGDLTQEMADKILAGLDAHRRAARRQLRPARRRSAPRLPARRGPDELAPIDAGSAREEATSVASSLRLSHERGVTGMD